MKLSATFEEALEAATQITIELGFEDVTDDEKADTMTGIAALVEKLFHVPAVDFLDMVLVEITKAETERKH